MQVASGILTKISDGKYSFLTMEDEFSIEGSLSLSNGFYSGLDLSSVIVNKSDVIESLSSDLFVQNTMIEASECLDLSDDCSNPNDCDCDCAEP